MSATPDITSTGAGARPGDPASHATDSDALLAEAARLLLPRVDAPYPGEVIAGRYRIERVLGGGGFGDVYLARDEELGREVALKMLGGARRAPTPAVLRLFEEEARTTAALNHPNIVTLHDFGRWNGVPYLVLERLAGETLRERLARGPLPPRAALSVAVQIARALVHAHAAGVIHRDLKPANVFLTAGGAKVLDFGIAHVMASDQPAGQAGTPAYMAPEQWTDEPQTARTDVFCAGVVLHEALTGAPPFGERGARDPSPPGRPARVPARLARIVSRATALAPTERYPDARALLAALEAEERRLARSPWTAAAGFGLVGAGVALALAVPRQAPEPPPVCVGADAKLAGLWDSTQRARVQARFAASDLPFAADSFTRAADRLDDYAGRWVAMHRDACEATRVRGEQSDELLDLRMACLESRRIGLRAVVEFLASPAPEAVTKAQEAALGLRPIAGCADVAALRAPTGPTLDDAQRDAIEAPLAAASVAMDAGTFAAGLPLATRAAEAARDVHHRPLEARARLLLGRLLRGESRLDEAEAALDEAAWLAEAGRDDETLVLTRIERGWLEGYDHSRIADGLRWNHAAAAVLERMGEPDDLRGLRLRSEGVLLKLDGRYDEAAARVDEGLAALRRADRPQWLAAATDTAANILDLQGRYAESLARHEESLALRTALYGPEHPNTTIPLGNMAIVLDEMGRHAESVEVGQRTVALRERVYGPDHIEVAQTLGNLGIALMHQRRPADAIAALERALRIRERLVGPAHASLAGTCGNLGEAYRLAGRLADAERLTRRGLALHAEHLGPDNPRTLVARSQLAHVLLDAGRPADAVTELREVLARRDERLGVDHPLTAETLIALGEAELGRGRPADALPHLERARTIYAAHPGDPATDAFGRFLLARALVDARGDRDRAVDLAEQARAALLALEREQGRVPDQLPEIDAWLARERAKKK